MGVKWAIFGPTRVVPRKHLRLSSLEDEGRFFLGESVHDRNAFNQLDSYLKAFDAVVMAVDKEQAAIELDRTAFLSRWRRPTL